MVLVITCCLLVAVSCHTGPVPVTEDSPVVIKVDTLFFENATWITGPELYYPIAHKEGPSTQGYFVVIGALLLAVSISGWVLFRHRRRIRVLQMTLDHARKEIASQEALFITYTDSNAVMDLLRERIDLVKTLLEKHDAMKQRKHLSYIDELEALQEAVQGYNQYLEELRSDKRFLGDLEKALDAGKDGLMRKTRALFGTRLTEEDYQILSCYFAGLDASTISFITGIKPGTIRTKKSRYKQRIESISDSSLKKLLLETLVIVKK